MKDRISKEDHQETLTLLDESLEWARSRNRTRLVELLNLIRLEVLFDMFFSEDPSSARNRTTAAEPAFGANQTVRFTRLSLYPCPTLETELPERCPARKEHDA